MSGIELKQLSEKVFYLPGTVNAAIVLNEEREAILLDTGSDKDHGRRLKKACDNLGVKPVVIVNTHSHADHYGGNDYLTRNFDLPVYAPPLEAGIIQNPVLEPIYLFSGAKPLPELMSKWLLAKPSRVDHILEPGALELFGVALEIIDSSGHAHRHYSVKIADVLVAADAVFGINILQKYPLPFGQDIGGQIASAERMADVGAQVILPGHGEASEDIAGLVKANIAVFEKAAKTIVGACTGVAATTVLKRSCEILGITIKDLPRYYLNHCTVMAYLSYLRESGHVELALQDNELRWSAAGN